MREYKVVFMWDGIKVTANKTQKELTELLQKEGVYLISVNDTGMTYFRRKKKS